MPELYRIVRSAYADRLDGEGARRYGGRWNPRGFPVVYASTHVSLAILEKLAHTAAEYAEPDLVLVRIEVDGRPPRLGADRLPPAWNGVDASHCQRVGERWLAEGSHPMLGIPSVLLPLDVEEYNVAIDPEHPETPGRVRISRIEPVVLDPRLLDRAD